jgi:hypothetical protein
MVVKRSNYDDEWHEEAISDCQLSRSTRIPARPDYHSAKGQISSLRSSSCVPHHP